MWGDSQHMNFNQYRRKSVCLFGPKTSVLLDNEGINTSVSGCVRLIEASTEEGPVMFVHIPVTEVEKDENFSASVGLRLPTMGEVIRYASQTYVSEIKIDGDEPHYIVFPHDPPFMGLIKNAFPTWLTLIYRVGKPPELALFMIDRPHWPSNCSFTMIIV